MIIKDLKNGYTAVPRDAVTLNGIPLPQLNTETEPYDGHWHIIAPNGRAIDGESGRPYVYDTLEEATEAAKEFAKSGEHSTCGGPITKGFLKKQRRQKLRESGLRKLTEAEKEALDL